MEITSIKDRSQYELYCAEAHRLVALDPESESEDGKRLGLLVRVIEEFEISEFVLDRGSLIKCFWQRKLRYFFRSIRHVFQKVTRGYSDYDLYSLDATLCAWLAPRFRTFREHQRRSHPSCYEEQEWQNILDKIEFSVNSVAKGEHYLSVDPRIQEGLELLGKNMLDLWW